MSQDEKTGKLEISEEPKQLMYGERTDHIKRLNNKARDKYVAKETSFGHTRSYVLQHERPVKIDKILNNMGKKLNFTEKTKSIINGMMKLGGAKPYRESGVIEKGADFDAKDKKSVLERASKVSNPSDVKKMLDMKTSGR